MNTRRMVLALALAVLPAAAFGKPNFSGEWKLNAAKSDFGPMPAPSVYDRKIAHDEPSLQVNTKQSGQQGEITTEMKYKTDGSESVNTIRGTEVKAVCKWDGDVLTIESKRSTQQGEITITERWALGDDGKAIAISGKISGGFGEFEVKIHLEKQ